MMDVSILQIGMTDTFNDTIKSLQNEMKSLTTLGLHEYWVTWENRYFITHWKLRTNHEEPETDYGMVQEGIPTAGVTLNVGRGPDVE